MEHYLEAAKWALEASAEGLRDALKGASAVESLAIMEHIRRSAELARSVGDLLYAHRADRDRGKL